ncbi:hypothetical protein ILUMI_17229 [Ignelater luminosus]|uniref:YqaJ viral recombinase domain-containing protein n=1 Tax=Ignelater luminosus TaxID=2038154 RepID=A0A8K0G7H0_IGNLU|nr:hypothetical protein ILUMI_17229 [Ignelater luminosus]
MEKFTKRSLTNRSARTQENMQHGRREVTKRQLTNKKAGRKMFACAANDYGATTSNMLRHRTSLDLEAIEKGTIKTSKSRHSIVESLMNPKKLSNPYVNYGIEKEPLAKIQFERMYSKEIVECGLFIDLQEFYSEASSDAIIQGENAIMEIKTKPWVFLSGAGSASHNKAISFAGLQRGWK